ncbi:DNA primase [Erysipelothrix urinaevulpis]|uniref:DNA primase n=1 Tax=Erysipelothrix urinaevulpis TaxID=2683717 RepID=UPI0013594EE8|nr:DNA primase [Erysipelothrix urinaevulpis]
MKRIPESLIQDIRNKTDIVDFISRYLPLNRKGKNYWGVCPFHDDNDPSMSVSQDKQIYKCFVCNHGGNVFQFVQDYEKINFIDAVIKVGESINLDLSEYQGSTPEVDPKLAQYYTIMEEAQSFLQYQLRSEQGKEALNLLYERGYNDDILEHFGVGVALTSVSLSKFLLAKSYTSDDLVDVNLSRWMDEDLRDVFFDRLMFPIHNKHGKIVAYSGRAIARESTIKYINTSNTPIYVKGEVVYNSHRAKNPARHQQSIIVCEGVTDVFAFTIAGHDNVVSLLGVAGTDQQIQEVSQLNKSVILAFDGDGAGQAATFAIGKKFKRMHCEVHIWYNDSGLDPDDLLREHGQSAISDGLENKIAWLDYVMYYAIGTYGLNSFENKKKVAEFVLEELKHEDHLAQDYYMNLIADKTNLDVSILSGMLHNKQQKQERKISVVQTHKQRRISATIPEQTLLKQMLGSKEAAYRYRDALGFFIDDSAQNLGLLILDAYRIESQIQAADLLSKSMDEEVRDLLFHIEASTIPSDFDQKVFDENIRIIKRRLDNMGMDQLKQDSINQFDIGNKAEILVKAILKKREGENK